jgi:hypothetical protein
MAISSNNRVWIKNTISLEHNRSKPLEVNLMNNTVSWWNNSQVVESFLAPFKECKTFLVPAKF